MTFPFDIPSVIVGVLFAYTAWRVWVLFLKGGRNDK